MSTQANRSELRVILVYTRS